MKKSVVLFYETKQNPSAGSETWAITVWEEDNCEIGVKYNMVWNAINFPLYTF